MARPKRPAPNARGPLTIHLCHCTDDSAPGTITASLSCEECHGSGVLATKAGEGFTFRARLHRCLCSKVSEERSDPTLFGCEECQRSGVDLFELEVVTARGQTRAARDTLRAMARELAEAEGVEERRTLAAAGLSVISEARFYGSEDALLTTAESILGTVRSLRSDEAAHEAARTLAAILDGDVEVSPTRGSTAAAA